MESSESEPNAPEPRRPVALIVGAGREPDPYLTDSDAQASWASVTVLWHPAVLAALGATPSFGDVAEPQPPQAGDLILVAEGSYDRVPSGFRTQAADIGATIVDGLATRSELVDELRRVLEATDDPAAPDEDGVAEDFMALGAAVWWLADLTVAMGHADCLNRETLAEETLAGARAWREGDHASAKNRLRAAFEVLTQAREKFYPVDAYLVDLCLVDPNSDPATLAEVMRPRIPTTLLAPALAVDNVAKRDPERIEAIREGVRDGWLDVVGGSWSEPDEPLLPWPSVIWQYRKGAETYRLHLDDRNVETWARRRFGLHSQAPQIAKRFGLKFGLPFGFDGGKFPLRSEVKRLWESPDGSTLECLYRPPISVEHAGEGVRLPWRLGLSMRDDHTATIPLIHWTTQWADWYRDLRRIATYASVLCRWITVNDYFHLTDRPFEGVRPLPDDYTTPYLDQATARDDDRPISRRAEHARLRAELDAAETVRSFAACLSETSVDPPAPLSSPDSREDRLELGDWDDLRSELATALPHWGKSLSRSLLGEPVSTSRPGYLVVNPLGQPRRATVLLPDAAPDLQPDGPLRVAQFTDEGVWAVVDLPAFGYAWVPKENAGAAPAPPSEVTTESNRIKNANLEIVVDPATGGLRGVHGPNEPTARLGQQLVLLDYRPSQPGAPVSRMLADKVEQDYGGPALAQTTSTGTILDADGRVAAKFEQRVRVWSGRPTAELDVLLSELDSERLDRMSYADPWSVGFACRWAWPDKDAMIRRLEFGHPWDTVVERIETAEGVDVSTRRQRAAILFGGLAHHKRHSTRMLDTLLVVGREAERRFKFGVALDLEHPFQAATEWLSPAVVVPTKAGPPRDGPATGWLFSPDAKSVSVGAVRFTERSGDGRGWGTTLQLVETAGRSTRVKVRCFRNPVWARQIDFLGDLLVDLTVEEDGFLVELTPHEIAYVDVTLG